MQFYNLPKWNTAIGSLDDDSKIELVTHCRCNALIMENRLGRRIVSLT